MNYKEAAEYAKTIGKRGIVLELENMEQLLSRLGNPQKGLKAVHVAGTNGKGSVIAYLSEILIRAGYRTGVYTSPAVFEPLEIYRINGEMISEDRYGQLMGKVRQAAEQMQDHPPTLFEMETALALLYFAEEACEIVLLETGLGGRLDATNCIEQPICSVLTSISYDHQAMLGDTLEEIAAQKAGIVKEGCPVVSCSQQETVMQVIREACQKKHARLQAVESQNVQWQAESGSIHKVLLYKDRQPMKLGLLGHYQLENAAAALETIEILRECGYAVEDVHIRDGLESVRWPGRLTILNSRPLILMDGAHNERAAQQLIQVLEEEFAEWQWTFIVGVLADKQYERMIRFTAPYAEQIITITPDHTRALRGEMLAETARRLGYASRCAGGLGQAADWALDWCEEEDHRGILAFGSFTFLKEFKEEVQRRMLRVNQIIHHPLFIKRIEQIERLEQERCFCHHGWEHCMDTARILALLNEERKLGFSREFLYAMALVHDLGRGEEYISGIPHEEAGVRLADEILRECGFDSDDITAVTTAVRYHRDTDRKEDAVTKLLAEADKKTRPCFRCRAREQCKWPKERKNRRIEL